MRMVRTLLKRNLLKLQILVVRKFEITFQEHSSGYDFYNSEALVDEFLLNVKNRLKD